MANLGLLRLVVRDQLGHFEVLLPTPATNVNVEVIYIVDERRILLCSRDHNRQEFLELRRVETEVPN